MSTKRKIMKTTFDTVIFYVHNVELLTDFYVDNFGFSIQEQSDGWTLLDSGSVRLGLHRMGAGYTSETPGTGSNVKLVFETEESIETARSLFCSRNIPMREIKTFPGYAYWLCDGTDPEGNVFQLKSRTRG